MSQESATPDLVEFVRAAVEALNHRDFDALMSFYAPDAVSEAPALGTSFEGVAAIRGFLEDWLGAYEEFKVEPQELLDLGSGVVFCVARQKARLAGSTGLVPLQEVWVYVFVWVQCMLARVTVYSEIDEPRTAAERLAESRR